MKKLRLLDTICVLIIFVMVSSADAASIASDDTTITIPPQSHAQTFAESPSSFPGGALTLNVPGESAKMQPDENFNNIIDETLSESPRSDSRKNLWLLLAVAFVFGIISEIFNRGSFKGVNNE